MACCRAANLFGNTHRLEIPNASTLLFSSISCSAPGRVHFHRVIVDEDDSRRPSSSLVVCWSKRLFGSLAWDRHQFGANASSSSSRRHLADAWLGNFALNSARSLRCSPATRAAHAHHCDGNGGRHLVAVRLVRKALWRDPKPSLRPGDSGCGSSRAPSASARLRKGSPHRRRREPWLRRAGNPACRLHRIS